MSKADVLKILPEKDTLKVFTQYFCYAIKEQLLILVYRTLLLELYSHI